MSGATTTRLRGPRLVAVLIAIVGLASATLLGPEAAKAGAPPFPLPTNNGAWDGGPYHITGGFKTVQEMPNHHLFAAGDSVTVTNPVTNAQVTWSPPAGWTNTNVTDSAGQSDGKIIIVGNHGSGPFLTRLVYDGSTLVTDPTFSTSVDFPYGELGKVTVLPDDTIVVGGAILGVIAGPDYFDISGVVKLTEDGELISDWRAGGSSDTQMGDFNYVVALDSDPTTGAIYIGGYTNEPYNFQFFRKYSAAGALDTNFVANVGTYFTPANVGFDFDAEPPTAIKVLSNQQILLGVAKSTGSSRASFRLNADGTNDSTYVGANLYASDYIHTVLDFAEMSTGKYLISGGSPPQRVNSNGSIDTSWTCGATISDPVYGCGRAPGYPITLSLDFDDPKTNQAIELKNGKVLVANERGTFTLLAVGQPKVTDVSADGRKLLRIDTYADVNGSYVPGNLITEANLGGTKLYGFTIQYNNAARQGVGKPTVIWGRFLKPPTGLDSSITIDLTSNQAVATCQANLVVVGKPRPACFRNAEIDTNLTSPRTYSVFLMFQDNTLYPQSPFSLYSYGLAANPVTIAP